MKTYPAKLTSKHPQAYRSGETAYIMGVVWAKPSRAKERPCLLIMFEDGEYDTVPLESIGPNFVIHK